MKIENEDEKWVDVRDFPKYEISSEGKIRNKKNQRYLKHNITLGRYHTVCLSMYGKTSTRMVSKIMMESFYPNEKSRNVKYLDGNPENITLSNLAYVDKREENEKPKINIYKDLNDLVTMILPFLKRVYEISQKDETQYNTFIHNIKTLIKKDLDYIVLNRPYDGDMRGFYDRHKDDD